MYAILPDVSVLFNNIKRVASWPPLPYRDTPGLNTYEPVVFGKRYFRKFSVS